MPVVNSKAGLQGVVVGVCGAFLKVDVEQRRKEGRATKMTWHSPVIDAVACKVSRRNLGLRWLIDVAEAEEFVSVGTDVADFENHLPANLPLQIQIEILHVRGPNVLVDTESIGHQ